MVDYEINYTRISETNPPADKEKNKEMRNILKKYSRFASMLTPMSKYYCSEMCNSTAYDAIQVLGGSGYMRDYAAERYYRDARITTIYEGTSQLQIVAAVRGVCNGTAERLLTEYAAMQYGEGLKDLLEKLAAGTEQLKRSITYVKENGNEYMDLYGRAIVDIAIDLICGYLFCGQASTKAGLQIPVSGKDGKTGSPQSEGEPVSMKERKTIIARRFINKAMPEIAAMAEQICSGDKSTLSDYEKIVLPVPGE
jgi:hypothetical protein